MSILQTIYIALLVFGAGVLVVDFSGLLSHGDAAPDHGGDAAGHDGHDASGHDSGGGHDAIGHDGSGHGGSTHHAQAERSGPIGTKAEDDRGSGAARTAAVSRIASFLRLSVFFALGAGLTGLFGIWRGLGPLESAAWSAGAGLVAAGVARLVRGLSRRELDSTVREEELIMDEAVITVSVAPGQLGKAEVRKYGANTELYVKASAPDLAIAKGARVRILDINEEYCTVEPLDLIDSKKED